MKLKHENVNLEAGGHRKLPRLRRQRVYQGALAVAARAARSNRIAAGVVDRVFWRLPAPLPASTYFGADMLCDPKDLIQGTILRFGVWEPNISALFESILDEGDVVVDVGSNCGYDTLLGAALVGPTGKVVAIEASPKIFRELVQNVALNPQLSERVVLINAAASDKNEELRLYSGPASNVGATTLLPSRDYSFECTVQSRPLTDLVPVEVRHRVRVVKIDVEGSELPVLRDLLTKMSTYSRLSFIIVEVSPSPEWSTMFAQIRNQGFDAYCVINEYDREYYRKHYREYFTPKRVDEPPSEQTDLVFVKRGEEITHRPVVSRWVTWKRQGTPRP